MRRILNLCVVVLGLAAFAPSAVAQSSPPAAIPQTRPAHTRLATTQPAIFHAHATLGPVLPVPETDVEGNKVCRCDVYGPVWDGVNKGLWVVLHDTGGHHKPGQPLAGDPGSGPCTALLIDPTTGRANRAVAAPSSCLLGHDGVGLWFEVSEESSAETRKRNIFQRVRTAPALSQEQQAGGAELPQDLPAAMPSDTFRFSGQAPVPSVFDPPRIVHAPDVISSLYLWQLYLDSQAISVYGRWQRSGDLPYACNPPIVAGAGYLWIFTDRPQRISLSTIKPLPIDGSLSQGWRLAGVSRTDIRRNLEWASADRALTDVQGGLAWDDQHLWSLSPETVTVPARGSFESSATLVRSVRLVRIDVGLCRKPDTTDRHNKALAFEKKNGTLKAIPLFEELIAYDPAAVEIRNHLAWALATRPREPYHDIQRAKKLVESALEWQPWNPEFWDTLAEIHWRLGDAKLAEHLEAKAINLYPAKTFYWRQLDKFRAGAATQAAPEPAY
jgi:tetratricopeptide (TPR) repeat protein